MEKAKTQNRPTMSNGFANSIAIILQLALAIDYSIIFSHRYQDEALVNPSTRAALEKSLAESILEISSSSLTTISGLGSLLLMQFRPGWDLGMVLSKGILFSLLSVFLLMPGLIALFPHALQKTAHPNLVPSVRVWGKGLMKSGYCFVWIYLLILLAAFSALGVLLIALFLTRRRKSKPKSKKNEALGEIILDRKAALPYSICEHFTVLQKQEMEVPSWQS